MNKCDLTRAVRAVVVALLAFNVVGCDRPKGRVDALPAAPTPSVVTPAPSPRSGPSVSGMVFETTPQGRRPLVGSRVWLVEDETVTSAVTDTDGRYAIPHVPGSARRRIVALPPIGRQLFQRSAAAALIDGGATVDIELVAEGTRGGTYGSPVLSGVIYRTTPQGRQPWPHTPVVFKTFDGPWYEVYEVTDAEGRYDFGRLPLGAGHLGAGNCNDQMQFTAVDVRGDTVADVDITPLVTTCSGFAF